MKGTTVAEKQITLIEPTETLREAYLDYVKELRFASEPLDPWVLERPAENFPGLVCWLKDQSNGLGLKEGWVASSTFWLTCGKERILGVVNLRHQLTDKLRDIGGHIGYGVRPSERNKGYATLMLRLTLEKARGLGIERVLVTCDADNIPSARVIQKNGGVLDSESHSEQTGRITQRYWIELKAGVENDVCD